MKANSNARSDSSVKLNQGESDEVLREWRESAFYWQKHLATIRMMYEPVTQALIESAGVKVGSVVLDVAGGSGEPSLTIAEKIGPTGSIISTDAVLEMLKGAEIEAQRRGLTNITFQQCRADSLPFESNLFDAVVCRLGVMFFPDPLAALREMLRVTKPNGSLALAVWGKSELNPFSYLITDTLARHFGEAAPSDPHAPGAFRFAESDSLAEILRQAGAIHVIERAIQFHIEAPISPKEFWDMRSETSGTLREKLATLQIQQRERLGNEIQDAVREFFPDGHMRFPAQMMVVNGIKSKATN